MGGQGFRHAWICLSDIEKHPKVQRAFRRPWGEEIAANFDPDKFGALYVIPHPRKPGKYLVFDGQHRHWGASKAIGKDQRVPCRIYEDRTVDELAKMALGLNSSKAWRAVESFAQRVIAKEPQAVAIQHVLAAHQLHVHPCMVAGSVRATGACDWVVERAGGIEALDRVISVLSAAWGRNPDAYHQHLIKGVALLYGRYDGKIDSSALVAGLQKRSGPGRLIGRSRDFAKATGEVAPRATARVMAADYNRGRRTARLPQWA